MDAFLQGCPQFSGEDLTDANKRDLVRLAAQWQKLTIAPKTYAAAEFEGAAQGRKLKRTILVPWSDKEWGLVFRTCFDEVQIPGVPSLAVGGEGERRRLFVQAIRSSVEEIGLDFNDA
eukprot:tig00020734_g13597.t1